VRWNMPVAAFHSFQTSGAVGVWAVVVATV
jgi:hypothetical protein